MVSNSPKSIINISVSVSESTSFGAPQSTINNENNSKINNQGKGMFPYDPYDWFFQFYIIRLLLGRMVCHYSRVGTLL
jgi:hypothetical protein